MYDACSPDRRAGTPLILVTIGWRKIIRDPGEVEK